MAKRRFVTNIQEVRKERGMTQQEVGQGFRKPVDITMISRWERGVVRPTATNLLELARVLKINPAKLHFVEDRQDSL
ncbi:XRE family transcriptional regulator [Paenibacillus rhizophilus]|uniref:XRE family transcriptional regulator n=1 Tax=Paenibacillus rhizophilus TaxID=1850366 RepID=A0A3N9P2G3_9BACL|nr:XRE family transcriptional regulator [Paenibacillus rhizophilus]